MRFTLSAAARFQTVLFHPESPIPDTLMNLATDILQGSVNSGSFHYNATPFQSSFSCRALNDAAGS